MKAALTPLVLVFGVGEQARANAFWAVYEEALGDLPRIALDRALIEYQRTGKFFPKPAEIRELAMPHTLGFRQAAYRAKKALEPSSGASVPESSRIPPEQFAALMADFVAKMAARDPMVTHRMVLPPTPQAMVDEAGISAEARAMLHRQGRKPANDSPVLQREDAA